MQTHLIFWPMLLTLAIPILILFLNGKRKKVDRETGELDPNSAIDNTAWSLPVVLTSNALANQFQLPVVFYVLCLILVQLQAVNIFVLVLCWLFAVSRCVHAFVHVTTNHIPHRMMSFIVSCMLLLILFGTTVGTLAQM